MRAIGTNSQNSVPRPQLYLPYGLREDVCLESGERPQEVRGVGEGGWVGGRGGGTCKAAVVSPQAQHGIPTSVLAVSPYYTRYSFNHTLRLSCFLSLRFCTEQTRFFESWGSADEDEKIRRVKCSQSIALLHCAKPIGKSKRGCCHFSFLLLFVAF